MPLTVHRPGCRHFALTNVYLHSGNKTAARDLASKVMERGALLTEDFLLKGDWNFIPSEEPIFTTCLSGAFHQGDEAPGPLVNQVRTRKGRPPIDYCRHSTNLPPLSRIQEPGVADHDLVCYDFSICASLNRVLKPSFSKVVRKEPVTVDEWNMVIQKRISKNHLMKVKLISVPNSEQTFDFTLWAWPRQCRNPSSCQMRYVFS